MNSKSVPSLLSVLRAPKSSDLTRKRKIKSNSGKRNKVHASSSAICSSESKGVKAVDRVKKYPNEQLNVSAGKLFCKACSYREELSLKSCSLLKSQKQKICQVAMFLLPQLKTMKINKFSVGLSTHNRH